VEIDSHSHLALDKGAPPASLEVCPLLAQLLRAMCALVLQPQPLPFLVFQWEAADGADAIKPVCVVTSRCVGSLLNRVPERAAELLARIVEAEAATARASGDPSRRHRAALLYVWAVKGLLQRSHPLGAALLATLLDWLADAAESAGGGGADAPLPAAKGSAFANFSDARLVLTVGGGLFSATEENEPMSEFSREAGGNVRDTYRQRIFAAIKARCKGGGAQSVAALFVLCAMLTHLPAGVLLQDTDGNMALVVRALQLVGRGSGDGGAEGAVDADCASLTDSVRVAALKAFVSIVTRAPASAEPHVIAIAPPLLRMACFAHAPEAGAPRPLVRACALDALRALAKLPHHRLHPVREQVLRGLLPALDDPKRTVRRRAGACRNDWAVRR
jgi:hypothetical protein